MSMKLKIFSPEKSIKKTISKLILTGGEGDLGILPNHARLITYLKPNKIKITGRDYEEHFKIGFGIVEVDQREVTIITEDFQQIRG